MIETEGFGGVNTYNGPVFRLEIDGESLLLQGPNASGKSSLVGAILWAVTGERLRDHSSARPEERAEVFDAANRSIGTWPPVACYPDDPKEFSANPHVRVTLTFVDPNKKTARIERQIKDGKLSHARDPALNIPDILVETGLLMPARMPHIRFEKESTSLTTAVQRLTGLDDLVDIGLLVDGLCNKGREYLATHSKELERHKSLFDAALAEARRALEPTGEKIAAFDPRDTENVEGALAALGKRLKKRSADLAHVIAEDIAAGIDLTSGKAQQDVAGAISGALEDLRQGLTGLPTWTLLTKLAGAIPDAAAARLVHAVTTAEAGLVDVISLDERAQRDTRFQLKALGAHWHEVHRGHQVVECPLCDGRIDDLHLRAEIEGLRRSAEAATRTLIDNLNAIRTQLESAVPQSIAGMLHDVSILAPRQRLVDDILERFVRHDRYSACLTKFSQLVARAIEQVPAAELGVVGAAVSAEPHAADVVRARIQTVRRLQALIQWQRVNADDWCTWWDVVAGNIAAPTSGSVDSTAETIDQAPEGFAQHLARLSDAIGEAAPFRGAAEALGRAWKSGRDARAFEEKQKKREEIAAQLAPLKFLGEVAQQQARLAIEGLSTEISIIMKRIYFNEHLEFMGAQIQRKAGPLIHASFDNGIKIDATLVANTSWLRALLWAFLFALRREAVRQLGVDCFPLLVLDDPQATFDAEHRYRWTQEIVGLQQSAASMQILVTTHDETFLGHAKIDGLKGRDAIIVAAGPELGRIGIFEGAALERHWVTTQTDNTPKAGQDYMAAVRVYVEGILRYMLHGHSSGVTSVGDGFVLGASRDKLRQLNAAHQAPWDKSEFITLVGRLDRSTAAIKHMEMAHHVDGKNLGMAEAANVQKHWRKELEPAVNRAFDVSRSHQLLHGGLNALHAVSPTISLPEGYTDKVRSLRLQVVGKAAALSGGLVADGRLDLALEGGGEIIVLGRHWAFRLNAPTMEPVARRGDILLVRELGEPPVGSLVVAIKDNKAVARRYQIAGNHSDVIVLTAQAVNPGQIAAPIVVKESTMKLHQVIGVIFDPGHQPTGFSEDEVSDCGGEAALNRRMIVILGLVTVAGQSAEPIVLDGQLLMIGSPISADDAISQLEGRPVIASDGDDGRYFKRLRRGRNDTVVLESLEISGDFEPVVLTYNTGQSTDLSQVWPVLGVLFERP